MRKASTQFLDDVGVQATAVTEEHLVRFGPDGWGAWRWVCIRGGGFPASLVLRLAPASVAAAADAMLDLESSEAAARETAIAQLTDECRQADADARRHLSKLLVSVKKGNTPSQGRMAHGGAAVESWISARQSVSDARATYAEAFASASLEMAKAIHRIAGDDRFREALAWQNRRALRGGVDCLLQHAPSSDSRDSRQRRLEELVASYAQRYSLKNDTVGFFGPVGWARLEDGGPDVAVRPGPGLVASRRLHLEVWAADAIAEALTERWPSLTRAAPPRQAHLVLADGQNLRLPGGEPVVLSEDERQLFGACDGRRPAIDVATWWAALSPADRTPEAGLDLLGALRDRGLIAWRLEAPIEAHPDQTLRRLIERHDAASPRQAALAELKKVESAMAALAGAAGESSTVAGAIDRLETTFTQLTGLPATRSDGEMFAGRTLVYEDCQRDLQASLGPGFLAQLAPALSLLLASARWLGSRAAEEYDLAFRSIYDHCVRNDGAGPVDFLMFWYRLFPLLWGDHNPILARLQADLQQRWQSVFDAPPGRRRVQYSSAEIRDAVMRTFAVGPSRWPMLRYHTPDLMVSARDVDAFRRGDYDVVLGELHMGVNTLNAQLFVTQHPSPADLFHAIASDVPRRTTMIVTKTFGKSARTLPFLINPDDVLVEMASEPHQWPRNASVPAASLHVALDPARGLVLRRPDGGHLCDLATILCDAVMQRLVNCYRMMIPPTIHNPRITIDRFVVSRESWSFGPDDVAFAWEESPEARFLAARRWMRTHGMPRFLFAKVPAEIKPFYVDFDSPVYVDLFARAVRRSRESRLSGHLVTAVEMLPTVDRLWLPDAQGATYTSELRMVCVDLEQAEAAVPA